MENRIGTAASSRYDSTQATEPLPLAAKAALKCREEVFNPPSQADEFLRRARTEQMVIARFPAGHPRGSWPPEEYAAELTASGQPAPLGQDIARDDYLVKTVSV
ncbi:hypothetical protein ACFV19_24675 [Streptomyces griseoluteus]|uniref:hypothetical protein n=1 Tax=Streptomyces griseoluteus TaxID=29306 RepID=UPI00368DE890